MDLLFHGYHFRWTLLLANVQFPIIGVDFLRHFHLMVDPAASRLVDKRSSQELSTISSIASGVAGDGWAGCHLRPRLTSGWVTIFVSHSWP
jgi:hypothetical protein